MNGRARISLDDVQAGIAGTTEPGKDQMVIWRRHGTKEEVLEPRDSEGSDKIGDGEEPRIRVKGVQGVILSVAE